MAKKGQDLVNAQDGVNNLPAVDFNNSVREIADAIFEGLPALPAPSGVANYGSTNEVKQALDINVLSRANCFVCTGGGNAYILTTDVAFQLRKLSYYYKYSRVNFTASFTNTGACTVKVDDGATVALEKGAGALSGGEIVAGSDYILEYDGSKWIVKNPSGGVYFKQQIILSNNTTDTNNDIDFSAGNFVFHDNTGFANLSAITKRLDANFAIGTNQGGLDTGSKQINTWYYCYAIYNPTTQVSDVVFSASDTSPTLPSGYTKYRYIGVLITNASGNIISGTWHKDGYFEYNTPIVDFSGSLTTSRVARIVSAKPNSRAVVNCFIGSTIAPGSVVALFLSDMNKVDNGVVRLTANINYQSSGEFQIQTNASSQIGTRANSTNNSTTISTIGFYDLDL